VNYTFRTDTDFPDRGDSLRREGAPTDGPSALRVDVWTIKRLTCTPGLRFDYLNAYDQPKPGSERLHPGASFPKSSAFRAERHSPRSASVRSIWRRKTALKRASASCRAESVNNLRLEQPDRDVRLSARNWTTPTPIIPMQLNNPGCRTTEQPRHLRQDTTTIFVSSTLRRRWYSPSCSPLIAPTVANHANCSASSETTCREFGTTAPGTTTSARPRICSHAADYTATASRSVDSRLPTA